MRYLILGIISFLLISCAAPRSIKDSGRVNESGEFKVGYHSNVNLPSNTLGYLSSDAIDIVNEEIKDSSENIQYDEKVNSYNKTLIAHSLDPVGVGSEFYLKYGVGYDTELGFSYTGNAFVYDVGYQIFHEKQAGLDGALSLQYSSQNYDLPSYLGDFQNLIGYEFTRKDVLGVLRLSKPLGEDEKIGHLGYGFALGYSQLSYGFDDASNVLVDKSGVPLESIPQSEISYFSYGSYVNAKFGYKWVYFVLGLSVFYQEYGELLLPNGKTIYMDGYTIIPSYGLQVKF